jgi:hypothetical protein
MELPKFNRALSCDSAYARKRKIIRLKATKEACDVPKMAIAALTQVVPTYSGIGESASMGGFQQLLCFGIFQQRFYR